MVAVVILCCAIAGWVFHLISLGVLYYLVNYRNRTEPPRWPSFSILKPLAGLDDELVQNLESHLNIDYPGEWEILLGVRSEKDAAYPIAKAFAEQHPARVRLIMQEGEPGLNPKVNQLITLTKHAKYETIALTDANVRVRRNYLREHAMYLSRERVVLSSHAFVGVGEETLGSAFDNMTLTGFVIQTLAMGDIVLRISQIVSKSLAIKRTVLEEIGGWELVKDFLAEDQRLGRELAHRGFRTSVCATPVENVQKSQDLAYFWHRHARWSMIRFRVLAAVWLEPILNPTFMSVLVVLFCGDLWWAPWVVLANFVDSIGNVQISGLIARNRAFAWKWALLMPLRDLVFFGTWVRGFFKETVEWRGNVFKVGKKTALTPASAEAIASMQRQANRK